MDYMSLQPKPGNPGMTFQVEEFLSALQISLQIIADRFEAGAGLIASNECDHAMPPCRALCSWEDVLCWLLCTSSNAMNRLRSHSPCMNLVL